MKFTEKDMHNIVAGFCFGSVVLSLDRKMFVEAILALGLAIINLFFGNK